MALPPAGKNEVDPIATKTPEDALRRGDRANGEGVRVLTVDDQAVFRKVAAEVIAATPGFECAGEAESGEEAIAKMARLNPDMVLIDVRMPGMGGLEAAHRIVLAHPETVVVLISIEDPEEIVRDERLRGVADLVWKQDFGPSLLRRLWERHGGSTCRD
jgi:DNA-binding NarL/FixJ family response regulator